MSVLVSECHQELEAALISCHPAAALPPTPPYLRIHYVQLMHNIFVALII